MGVVYFFMHRQFLIHVHMRISLNISDLHILFLGMRMASQVWWSERLYMLVNTHLVVLYVLCLNWLI
jgi:hypothetical protein